ncbi:hypothetical protein BCE_A0237 (plasmid) [Bacillus cereus ATCC 10987]|uniref:Uncharacterized protein n=1 Tax=Bacillus cereus (strain ATCC 10987 / NRS 248) TaxID=222523 RepID=Q74NK8_BACC1|nr:hypothetical protein BCE_A0237 [Bacillus cereus ATCC 10987]
MIKGTYLDVLLVSIYSKMKNINLIHFILEGYFQSFSFRVFRASLNEFVESVCFSIFSNLSSNFSIASFVSFSSNLISVSKRSIESPFVIFNSNRSLTYIKSVTLYS